MLIEINKLTMKYSTLRSHKMILNAIDLNIEANSFVAITGRSGSGKTTLLNLIGGLLKPVSGEICVNGEKITSYHEARLAEYRRKNIGYVFQTYNLMPELTVYENILLPIHLDKQKEDQKYIDQIMKTLNIEQLKDEMCIRDRSYGIHPNLIVTRSDAPLDNDIKRKISAFCNVKSDCVIDNQTMPTL